MAPPRKVVWFLRLNPDLFKLYSISIQVISRPRQAYFLINYSWSASRVILYKTGPIVFDFHWYGYVTPFGLFKVTLKMVSATLNARFTALLVVQSVWLSLPRAQAVFSSSWMQNMACVGDLEEVWLLFVKTNNLLGNLDRVNSTIQGWTLTNSGVERLL